MQVNGAVGCLTRLPVPHEAFRLRPTNPSVDSSEEHEAEAQAGLPRWSKELWNPYLRRTALRVFASCGLSAQVRLTPV